MFLKLETKEDRAGRQRKQSVEESLINVVNFNQQKNKKERKQSEAVSSNLDFLLFAPKPEGTAKPRKESLITVPLDSIPVILEHSEKEADDNENHEAAKKYTLIEKDILKQLQGHIDYFRLVFRVFRKMKDLLKTNDSGIGSFKIQLLCLFYSAVQESRQLKHIRGVEE